MIDAARLMVAAVEIVERVVPEIPGNVARTRQSAEGFMAFIFGIVCGFRAGK